MKKLSELGSNFYIFFNFRGDREGGNRGGRGGFRGGFNDRNNSRNTFSTGNNFSSGNRE